MNGVKFELWYSVVMLSHKYVLFIGGKYVNAEICFIYWGKYVYADVCFIY